jgi:hypothetical protein
MSLDLCFAALDRAPAWLKTIVGLVAILIALPTASLAAAPAKQAALR